MNQPYYIVNGRTNSCPALPVRRRVDVWQSAEPGSALPQARVLKHNKSIYTIYECALCRGATKSLYMPNTTRQLN